jgi:hypothetical protein
LYKSLEIWKKLLIFALKLIHMTKKKTMKNIKTPNKFNVGGDLSGAMGAIGSLGGIVEGLISNGFSTVGGQVLSGIGDVAMTLDPIVG